jgi:hypothetical protein
MEMNALDTALALLDELEAEVVDTCADLACEICRPVLELAA